MLCASDVYGIHKTGRTETVKETETEKEGVHAMKHTNLKELAVEAVSALAIIIISAVWVLLCCVA